MTNKDKFIDTTINAPVEQVACFIVTNISTRCRFCDFYEGCCNAKGDIPRIVDGVRLFDGKATQEDACKYGVQLWLEKEVD